MNSFAYAVKHVACPKCSAAAGVGCTLKSGKPATSCHNERLAPSRAYALRCAGFDEAYIARNEQRRAAEARTNARVKARKWMGDDAASWAVFIDGRVFVSGLTQSEVPYYKREAAAKIEALHQGEK